VKLIPDLAVLKEHEADIRKERTRTSTLAEHSLKTKHHVFLEDTKILAKEGHYYKRCLREAIEIIKHPNNMNRDGGLEVSSFWHPLILSSLTTTIKILI
jgi:hypothetical protein